MYGTKRTISKEVQLNMHNRFDIEVVDFETNEIKQTAVAHNVICSNLWNRIFMPETYFNYIHYGTGSGTPSSTDSSLFTFAGYLSFTTADYAVNPETGVMSLRRKSVMGETVAVGSTLSEIGIGYSTSNSSLCTHAMLKDANGNPITIQKTDRDIINIYATVFLHVDPNGYDNGAINLLPRSNDVNAFSLLNKKSNCIYMRLLGMSKYSTSYAFINAHPKNNIIYKLKSSAKSLTWSGDLPQKKLTATMARLTASENLSPENTPVSDVQNIEVNADITDINLGYNEAPDIMIKVRDDASWFSKYQVTDEAIGTGDGTMVDFKTKFGYVKNPHIFVDGVEQTSGVQVTLDTPMSNALLGGDSLRVVDIDGNYIDHNALGPYGFEGKTLYVENIDYSTRALLKVCGFACLLYGKNNLADSWTNINMSFPSSGSSYAYPKPVPEGSRNYRYYKLVGNSYGANYKWFTLDGVDTNIKFDIPPADGSVITASYETATIPKDENHVFDFSLTIQIGEYAQ